MEGKKRIGEGMRSRDREKVEGGETGKEQERGGKEWERKWGEEIGKNVSRF